MNKKIKALMEQAGFGPCEFDMFVVQGGNEHVELDRFDMFVDLFIDRVIKEVERGNGVIARLEKLKN
jgi:hypothetical protein